MCSTFANTDPGQDPAGAAATASQEVVRANLYQLLASAFSSPLEMEKKPAQQLREMSREMPVSFRETARSLAGAWEDALKDREALAAAYARHFLGPFEILTPPYASFYLEPDQRLMGEVSQHVARCYAEAGLGPGPGPLEAPDHVALEWEFMYYLTYQYLVSDEEQWIERRETFRATHLNRWMPRFAKAMTQSAEHAFYAAVARLLDLVLREDQ